MLMTKPMESCSFAFVLDINVHNYCIKLDFDANLQYKTLLLGGGYMYTPLPMGSEFVSSLLFEMSCLEFYMMSSKLMPELVSYID